MHHPDGTLRSREAANAGFRRAKFDKCFWYIRESDGSLGGVMCAHVDDTACGGGSEKFRRAIAPPPAEDIPDAAAGAPESEVEMTR